MKSNGVIYVATKRHYYVQAAITSARSLKDLCPDIATTLFTDLPCPPKVRDCFDSLQQVESVNAYHSKAMKMSSWGEGLLDRLRCLQQSPYDRTIFLDADTRVVSPEIRELFSLLDDYDIAMTECQPDSSYSRQHLGIPQFNAGVILYRKSEPTLKLLRAWEESFTRHLEAVVQNRMGELDVLKGVTDPVVQENLLCNDQVALLGLLSPTVNTYGLRVLTLDEGWNFRGKSADRRLDHDIKIQHREYLKTQARIFSRGAVRFLARRLLTTAAALTKPRPAKS